MSQPEGQEPSEDERFREIVAGFSDAPTDPVPRWPVSEDITEPRQTRWTGAPRRRDDAAAEPESTVDPLPDWVEPAALDDDGHYEPPPAPKVPLPRLRTVGAWLVLLLGLAILFAPFQLGLSDAGEYKVLGLAITAGGAALLLTGMRDAPPIDSGPDDGAVV